MAPVRSDEARFKRYDLGTRQGNRQMVRGMTGLRVSPARAASVFVLGGVAAQEPKKGGTVHVVVQPEPPMLMQGLNQNGPTNMVAGNIYESLLRYDEKLNPQPSLAKSWEISPDSKVYTVKLQEGVKWHDG